jgi:hypothetical protein
MHAEVFRGQLTYVNTDDGRFQIRDLKDDQETSFTISDKTKDCSWERLIGSNVEAIVVNDTVTKVYEIDDEDN